MSFAIRIFVISVLGYQLLYSCGVCEIQDCRAKLDLVIIVDSSLSVGIANFKKVTAFIKTFVGYLPVEKDAVRVGLLRYASKAQVISYLNDNMDKDRKLAAIESMAYRPGSTYTHLALQLARTDVLTPKRGDRPDVTNLVILLTDGESKNQTWTINEAMALKRDDNLKIFSIGIGKEVVDKELEEVASRPEMVYKLTDFAQLTDILGNLATFSCSDMKEESISALKSWSNSEAALIVLTSTQSSTSTYSSSSHSSSTRLSTPSSTIPTTSTASSSTSTTVLSSTSFRAPGSNGFLTTTDKQKPGSDWAVYVSSLTRSALTDNPQTSQAHQTTRELTARQVTPQLETKAIYQTEALLPTFVFTKDANHTTSTTTPANTTRYTIHHTAQFPANTTQLHLTTDVSLNTTLASPITTQTRLSTTQTSLSTTQTSLNTTQTSLSTTQTSLGTTQTALSTTRTSLSTTQTSLSTTQTSLSTTRTSLSTTQTSLSTTQTSLSTTQTNLGTTQTSLPTTQTSLPTTQTSLPTTQTSLPTTQTSLPTTQTSLSTARTSLNTTQTSLNKTQRQLNTTALPPADQDGAEYVYEPSIAQAGTTDPVPAAITRTSDTTPPASTMTTTNITLDAGWRHHTTVTSVTRSLSSPSNTVDPKTSQRNIPNPTISLSPEVASTDLATSTLSVESDSSTIFIDPTLTSINDRPRHSSVSLTPTTPSVPVSQKSSTSRQTTVSYRKTSTGHTVSSARPSTRHLPTRHTTTTVTQTSVDTSHTASTRISDTESTPGQYRTTVDSRGTVNKHEEAADTSSPGITVMIEYDSYDKSGNNTGINITDIDEYSVHGDHGGDVSSRDVYIFVAGGTATAFILLALATFFAVLARRRNNSRNLDSPN